MKYPLIKATLSCLIFLFYSLDAHADWTKVEAGSQYTDYADFDELSKHQGYVYYWGLRDFSHPTKSGASSS